MTYLRNQIYNQKAVAHDAGATKIYEKTYLYKGLQGISRGENGRSKQ